MKSKSKKRDEAIIRDLRFHARIADLLAANAKATGSNLSIQANKPAIITTPALSAAYIGVVALVIRMYERLSLDDRRQFDAQMGDPLARVAGDFNAHSVALKMLRNGDSWMLTERDV